MAWNTGNTVTAADMDGVGAVNSAANQISQLQGVAQANSAFNAEQAQIQREWTERQSARAMEFNAAEAQKNRDWQEMMSNTAHQREVKDLMAAGLNPVLSAMNGNGAAVTSGATASGVIGSGSKADADTSTSGAIANLLGSILSAQTQIQAANVNARTQEAVADKYTAMERIVAEISAAAGVDQANIHASASRYGADSSRLASVLGTTMTSNATRYAADQSRAAQQYSADTSWDIKSDFGNGEIAGIVGWLGERFANLFGGTLRGDDRKKDR